MIIKGLQWKMIYDSFDHKYFHYRADIKVKELFGVQFEYGKRILEGKEFYYKYIINGKKYGDYLGYTCKSLEEGKKLCKDKYIDICDRISEELFID